MPIIEFIIAQHAEEAAFLWLLRDAACHEPHYLVKDLAKLDDRVEAHLDGLRIARNEGRPVYNEAWAMEDAGEIFAASELAFESSDPDRIHHVLEIAASAPELSQGAVSAPQLGRIDLLLAVRSNLEVDDSGLHPTGEAKF